MNDMPDAIWASYDETYGAIQMGVWADTVRHGGGTEYRRADLPAPPLSDPRVVAMVEASDDLGRWMSAALEDQGVCDNMKADINRWFAALKAAKGGADT